MPELQKENEMLHTRVLELTAALDAHESPGEAVKRRRSTNIESELPISEVDLDNLCKREANSDDDYSLLDKFLGLFCSWTAFGGPQKKLLPLTFFRPFL